jgi:hypothetical protein
MSLTQRSAEGNGSKEKRPLAGEALQCSPNNLIDTGW